MASNNLPLDWWFAHDALLDRLPSSIHAVGIALRAAKASDTMELYHANLVVSKSRPSLNIHVTVDGPLPPSDWHKTTNVVAGTPDARDLDRRVEEFVNSRGAGNVGGSASYSTEDGSAVYKLLAWNPPVAKSGTTNIVIGGGALMDNPIIAWTLADTLGPGYEVFLWDVVGERGINVSKSRLLPGSGGTQTPMPSTKGSYALEPSGAVAPLTYSYRDVAAIVALIAGRPHIPAAVALQLLERLTSPIVGIDMSINWTNLLTTMNRLGDLEVRLLATKTMLQPDVVSSRLPPVGDDLAASYMERAVVDPIRRLRGLESTSMADPFLPR